VGLFRRRRHATSTITYNLDIDGRLYHSLDGVTWRDTTGKVADVTAALVEALGPPPPAAPSKCAICGGPPSHRCVIASGVTHDGQPLDVRQEIAWVGDGEMLWALCDHRHPRSTDGGASEAMACASELLWAFQRGDRRVPRGGARRPHSSRYEGPLAGGRRRPEGLTAERWREMVAAVDQRCTYCNRRFVRASLLEREHNIPLSRCGAQHVDNIVVACQGDNRRKGTMTGAEYREFLKLVPWASTSSRLDS
jgi:5-methylcytosine-specific restriction endonuclease McrA